MMKFLTDVVIVSRLSDETERASWIQELILLYESIIILIVT